MDTSSHRARLPCIVALVLGVLTSPACRRGEQEDRTEETADADRVKKKKKKAASAKSEASAKPSGSAAEAGGGASTFRFDVKRPERRSGDKPLVEFSCHIHFERAGAAPVDERTTCFRDQSLYPSLAFQVGKVKEVRIAGEQEELGGAADDRYFSLYDDTLLKYLELTDDSQMSSRLSVVLVYPDGEWKGTVTFDTELLRRVFADLPYKKKSLAKGEDEKAPGGPGVLVVPDQLAWEHQRVVGGATRMADIGRVAMVTGETRVIKTCTYKDSSGAMQSTPLGATDIEIALFERKTARKISQTTLRASTPAACADSTTKDNLHGSGRGSEVPPEQVTAWIDAQAKN